MQSLRLGIRLLLIIVGVAALILAFLVGPAFKFRLSASDIAVAFLLITLVGAAVAYVVITYRAFTLADVEPSIHARDTPAEFEPREIDALIDAAGNSALLSHQVFVFLGCVLSPRLFFPRISEHVESFHRSTLVVSTFTIRVAQASKAAWAEDLKQAADPSRDVVDYVIPLYLPPKNSLQDGIRVKDAGGARVSTLDGGAQATFVAGIVRYLLQLFSPSALTAYLADDYKVERAVWELITRDDLSATEIDGAIDQVQSLPREGDADLRTLVGFLREMAIQRPISVTVSSEKIGSLRWPSTLRFSLERRFISPQEPAPNSLARSVARLDTLRLALGVRIHRFYFPLTSAYRCVSYHLEIEGRHGTYFSGGELVAPHLAERENLQLEYRTQARRGQRRSHLYLRNTRGKEGAYYFARFFERSPGSYAAAFVTSLVSLTLISALWILAHGADPAALTSAKPLVPALLALPVAVAAFVGLEPSASRRHPSLATRFIAVMVAVLSLTAFVGSVVGSTPKAISPLFWDLLLWASASVTIMSLVGWVVRLATESRFVRASPDQRGED